MYESDILGHHEKMSNFSQNTISSLLASHYSQLVLQIISLNITTVALSETLADALIAIVNLQVLHIHTVNDRLVCCSWEMEQCNKDFFKKLSLNMVQNTV